MKYRKLVKDGDDVSSLGFGCMRFPINNGSIDEIKTEEILLKAFHEGVNYFDTAYPYHLGKSEVMLGKFIKNNNIREQVYIADKMPAYLVNKNDQFEKYFTTQLQRLDTHYIDYYLMHMLDSYKTWCTLKDLGVLKFIEEKKKNGSIRYIGFSFHGQHEEFIKILEDYNWDFCQIQYNYLDENYQAGKKGLTRAHELNIGVVIMEPLRGGNLANKAPNDVIQLFNSQKEVHSAAFWGLRWILNHPEVSVILSGMNELKHLEDNLNCADVSESNSMSKNELDVIEEVKQIYHQQMKVPCTGCGYCMPCPLGVDIPMTFSEYNSKYFFNKGLTRLTYIYRSVGGMGKKNGADQCVGCKKCMKHCPQNIQIPVELKKAHKELNNPVISFIASCAVKMIKRREKK